MSVWFTHLCGPVSAAQQVLMQPWVVVRRALVYLKNSSVRVLRAGGATWLVSALR